MQAYSLVLDIISGCWLVFVAIWVLGALSTKRTVYRESRAQRLRYWVLLAIAYVLQLYGRRLPYPLNIRVASPCSADRMGGCGLVRHRFGLRGLGQSHSRAELERCGDTKRRTRTGGTRTVPIRASSYLHRHTHHVFCHRARARTLGRVCGHTPNVCEFLDQTSRRGKTDAATIPRALRGLSATSQMHYSFCPLIADEQSRRTGDRRFVRIPANRTTQIAASC